MRRRLISESVRTKTVVTSATAVIKVTRQYGRWGAVTPGNSAPAQLLEVADTQAAKTSAEAPLCGRSECCDYGLASGDGQFGL
jgi:hypothetical protein